MQPAFDLSNIRLTLKKAVECGHFTVEHLDTPSEGFIRNTRCDRRTFPCGYEGVQHRNLLREPGTAPEAVQVTSERDLPPLPHGHTPPEADGPLTLDEQYAELPF